ncbi:MAG: histidinol dehydrogenase [Clostridium celatum]|nr:histidinol dehydrogenase [Clostridium celatum]
MIDIIELNNKYISDVVSIIKKRSNTLNIRKNVEEIIENVKSSGDKALRGYTLDFDKVYLENFKIDEEEIEKAFIEGDKSFINILKESIKNIKKYHEKQKKTSYIYQKEFGVYMGQRLIPVDSVAIYVPGGKAAYPSSVLMNAIPAKVAGVEKIVLVTPLDKSGHVNKNILIAAKLCGISNVYMLGGAQAIAALTYGTESIESVSMIVGPGNAFVAEAKRQVYGDVGIDMVAGPSEILIIADEKSNPKYIAADLMSQAEHDELASSILVTTSKEIAEKVNSEIKLQIEKMSRRKIIESSFRNFGKIVICSSIKDGIEFANLIAPEHLELLVDNPMEYLEGVKNAGSVFIGEYTPEPIGDYFGGTNHVLPTGGTARFSSPLSVDTFIKKSSFLYYSQKAVERDGEKIIRFATEEGLTAHANSIKVRLENEENK